MADGSQTRAGPSFAEIKRALLGRLDQLVHHLAPGGRKNGAYYMVSDPTGRRADKNPSFWVRLSSPAPGAWKDEVTGETGDVVDFVTHCCRLPNRTETRKWCLAWLGWGDGSSSPPPRPRPEPPPVSREEEERRAATDLADKRRRAKGWWLSATPMIEGTVAATYLAGRGIDLNRLSAPPRALRFLASAEHHDGDGVITEWPCMLAAMCDAAGHIVAVHRTFLKPDGSGKAPVPAAKKIWPHGWNGSVIRLAKGERGLSPEQAARQQWRAPLVVTEGIEDGLSIALACPSLRVWAAGSLGNMAHVPVDHPCVSKVIVFADNDAGPQARLQFDKAMAALRARRPLAIARSFTGKDANDLLRGLD